MVDKHCLNSVVLWMLNNSLKNKYCQIDGSPSNCTNNLSFYIKKSNICTFIINICYVQMSHLHLTDLQHLLKLHKMDVQFLLCRAIFSHMIKPRSHVNCWSKNVNVSDKYNRKRWARGFAYLSYKKMKEISFEKTNKIRQSTYKRKNEHRSDRAMLLPTITIQELLIETLKALGCFQQDPALCKVIKGHQDIFGVPPNIYNLKEKYVHMSNYRVILTAQERLLFLCIG